MAWNLFMSCSFWCLIYLVIIFLFKTEIMKSIVIGWPAYSFDNFYPFIYVLVVIHVPTLMFPVLYIIISSLISLPMWSVQVVVFLSLSGVKRLRTHLRERNCTADQQGRLPFEVGLLLSGSLLAMCVSISI